MFFRSLEIVARIVRIKSDSEHHEQRERSESDLDVHDLCLGQVCNHDSSSSMKDLSISISVS